MNPIAIECPDSVKEAPRPRLLVVDDDSLIRGLHSAVFQAAGYEVETAADGVEALVRLVEEKFDLVVTDRQMPNLDGASLILAMRNSGLRIPVIMVSGSPTLPPEVACEVSVRIPKPARSAELLSAVAWALRPPPAWDPQHPRIAHRLAA